MSDGEDAEPEEPFTEYGDVGDDYTEPEEPRPGPEIPEAPDLSNRDVDPVVAGAFWTLVVVLNVGLLLVSVGVMFVVFQRNVRLGGQLTIGGLVVLAYGVYRYRNAKAMVAERVADGSGADGDDSATDRDDADSSSAAQDHNE